MGSVALLQTGLNSQTLDQLRWYDIVTDGMTGQTLSCVICFQCELPEPDSEFSGL